MQGRAQSGVEPEGAPETPGGLPPVEEAEVEANSLLRPYGGVDDWFWVSAALNPYRGCAHGCTYCDGRSERYRLVNFDSRVEVKVNAPELLVQELSRMGHRRRGAPRTPGLEEFGVEVPPAAATEPDPPAGGTDKGC